jgi:murein DD-endopeptidase MepM/ murein hydrolase activator NlpD
VACIDKIISIRFTQGLNFKITMVKPLRNLKDMLSFVQNRKLRRFKNVSLTLGWIYLCFSLYYKTETTLTPEAHFDSDELDATLNQFDSRFEFAKDLYRKSVRLAQHTILGLPDRYSPLGPISKRVPNFENDYVSRIDHKAMNHFFPEKTHELLEKRADYLEKLFKQEEDFRIGIEKNLLAQQESIRQVPAITPAQGVITSPFGRRRDPFTGRWNTHSGIDIASDHGTPVVATADSTVHFAGSNSGGYGLMITLDHGQGYSTQYAHLQKILVQEGQKIKRGETIGLMGNSGRSTGPHLHYEVLYERQPIDPTQHILDLNI